MSMEQLYWNAISVVACVGTYDVILLGLGKIPHSVDTVAGCLAAYAIGRFSERWIADIQ